MPDPPVTPGLGQVTPTTPAPSGWAGYTFDENGNDVTPPPVFAQQASTPEGTPGGTWAGYTFDENGNTVSGNPPSAPRTPATQPGPPQFRELSTYERQRCLMGIPAGSNSNDIVDTADLVKVIATNLNIPPITALQVVKTLAPTAKKRNAWWDGMDAHRLEEQLDFMALANAGRTVIGRGRKSSEIQADIEGLQMFQQSLAPSGITVDFKPKIAELQKELAVVSEREKVENTLKTQLQEKSGPWQPVVVNRAQKQGAPGPLALGLGATIELGRLASGAIIDLFSGKPIGTTSATTPSMMPTQKEGPSVSGLDYMIGIGKRGLLAIGGPAAKIAAGVSGGGDMVFNIAKTTSDTAASFQYGLGAAIPTAAMGAAVGAAAGGVGALPAAAAVGTAGFTAGTTAYWTGRMVGKTYRDLVDGGADPKLAVVMAGIFGTLESIVETISNVQMYKGAIPGYAEAIDQFKGTFQGIAQDIAASPEFRSMANEATQRIAKGMTTETWEDFTQNTLDWTAKFFVDRIQGSNLTPSVKEMAIQQLQTLETTPLVALSQMAPGGIIQIGQGALQDARVAISEQRKALETTVPGETPQQAWARAQEVIKGIVGASNQLTAVSNRLTDLEAQRTEVARQGIIKGTYPTALLTEIDNKIAALRPVQQALIEQVGFVHDAAVDPSPTTDRLELAKTVTDPEAVAIVHNPAMTGEQIDTELAAVDEELGVLNVAKAEREALAAQVKAAQAKEAGVAGVEAIAAEENAQNIPETLGSTEMQAAQARVLGTPGPPKPGLGEQMRTAEAVTSAVDVERTRVSNLQEKKKALEGLKKIRDKYVQYITKPISDNVHVKEKVQIEDIQSGMSKVKAGDRTLKEIQASREYFAEHPEEVENLSKKDRALYVEGVRTQNEISTKELEEMASDRERLQHYGVLHKTTLDNQKKRKIGSMVESLKAALMDTKPARGIPTEKKNYPGSVEQFAGQLRAKKITLQGPERNIDALDGGKVFHGPWHEEFWNGPGRAESVEFGNTADVRLLVKKKLKQLGIKENELQKIYIIGGQDFRMDDMLGILAGWMNEKHRAAIEYGNNVTPEMVMEMAKLVPANMRKTIPFVMAIYDAQEPRVREAHIAIHPNQDPGHEENYTPAPRESDTFGDLNQTLMDEIERRGAIGAALTKQKMELGSMKKRLEIAAEHQPKVQLGLFKNLLRHYDQAEHFANFADLTETLSGVLGDKEVRDLLKSKRGPEMLAAMDDYLQNMKNPNLNKAMAGEKLVADAFPTLGGPTLKRRLALGFIAWRTITGAKQLTSYFKALPYMGKEFMSGVYDMVRHPVETPQFIEESDGVMKGRTYDRWASDMKQGSPLLVEKILKKFGPNGMALVWFVDKETSYAVWKSVYNHNVDKLGHEAAVQEARNAVLRTQSVGNPRHLPIVFRSPKEFIQMLTLFGIDKNQTWNIATYDIPQMLKNNKKMQAGATMLALTLGLVAEGILSHRRLPKGSEWWKWPVGEAIGTIQFVGSFAQSAMRGWQSRTEIPAGQAAGILGSMASNVMTGRYKKALNLADDLGYLMLLSQGLPAQEIRNILKGAQYIYKGDVGKAAMEVFAGGQGAQRTPGGF